MKYEHGGRRRGGMPSLFGGSSASEIHTWEWEQAELAALREHIDVPRVALERAPRIDPDYQFVPLADQRARVWRSVSEEKRQARNAEARRKTAERTAEARKERTQKETLAGSLIMMIRAADRELKIADGVQHWTCIGCGLSIRVTPTNPRLIVQHQIPTCEIWDLMLKHTRYWLRVGSI